ncbi:MAG: isochorismatase family protein [Planctomycetia bacterium]|nr:isochorismatase family protein [Planctomycetia bacterium]
MPRFLLFTQCLQNDFVAPVPAGRAIPNQLHIGPAESHRLLGDEPRTGPLGRFLEAFHAGAGADHAAVHIRDWHDANDPAQAHHLAHFGAHCLKGTTGAEYVPPLDALARGRMNSLTVDSTVLNDFEGTDLAARIRGLVGSTPPADVVAGIIGVWTDVKVQYLAYDLLTRLGFQRLVLCSALCASRSRVRHFQALDFLAQNLAVEVVDGIPAFLSRLGIGDAAARATVARYGVLLQGDPVDGEDADLARHLFRNCRSVRLMSLSGGFSGAKVFRTESVDQEGRREVPFVFKSDTLEKIAKERAAVERVENVLGTSAPAMADFADLGTRGAIKYFYASMHHSPVETLQSKLRRAGTPEAVEALFDQLWDDILVRLSQSPVRDRLHLFQHYQFRPEYAKHSVARAEALGRAAMGLPDPRGFYDRVPELLKRAPQDAPVAWVHGDLNYANVLMDDAGNSWLIDYFHTGAAHALKDCAKLENDLKFILLPVPNEAALSKMRSYEEFLLSQPSLDLPPGPLPASLAGDAALARCHAGVRRIRGWARELCAGVVSMEHYLIALLRYSAHTMGFEEPDELQRKHAMIATCLVAERLGQTAGGNGRGVPQGRTAGA